MNRIVLSAVTVAAGVAFIGCQPDAADTAGTETLTARIDSVSYVLGADVGNSLKGFAADVKLGAFMQGVKDALAGKEPKISQQDAAPMMQAYMQEQQAKKQAEMAVAGEKSKTEGDAFLAKNKAEPGVQTTASGLQYSVIKEGTGPKAVATDKVKVNYKGMLTDGKEFDSSEKHGGPAEFMVGQVIPGWQEGLQLMSVGSKYKFVIPSDLAYGPSGAGNDIPPNATLVFEVELVEIVK